MNTLCWIVSLTFAIMAFVFALPLSSERGRQDDLAFSAVMALLSIAFSLMSLSWK
jgi:hypothetical protein